MWTTSCFRGGLTPASERAGRHLSAVSCARQQLGEPVTTEPSSLTIVEGAYACHPDLWAYYDLRVFLDRRSGNADVRRIEATQRSGKHSNSVIAGSL